MPSVQAWANNLNIKLPADIAAATTASTRGRKGPVPSQSNSNSNSYSSLHGNGLYLKPPAYRAEREREGDRETSGISGTAVKGNIRGTRVRQPGASR